MIPHYKNIHNRFKINGFHLGKEALFQLAWSSIKEGEVFEKELGEFLLDWVANSQSGEVQYNEEIQAELEEFSEAIEQADFTYDKKNLYRVFTLRLVTQDRFYNSLFLTG